MQLATCSPYKEKRAVRNKLQIVGKSDTSSLETKTRLLCIYSQCSHLNLFDNFTPDWCTLLRLIISSLRLRRIDIIVCKKNLNTAKPPEQSKCLAGNIGCKDSGFRPNRSTTDMIFVIRRLQDLARKKRIPLCV